MTQTPSNSSPEIPRQAAGPAAFTRADLGAVGLLVASLVVLFREPLFTSALFFYRDICNYTYPTTSLIRELCRHGSLPYWNPYLNYGQPVLANPNLLFFYPSTLLILLAPFDLAYTLHYVLHFALAGIGTYLLARVWGQSYRAAFFAAFIFVFSGPVLSLGNFYNTTACCAWIPWALLATDRALETRRLRSWVLLVVVFALQWLAAEPLTMMATFGLSFAYAFYRCGTRDRLWSKPNIRMLIIYGLIGGGMLLLCAVQLLPALDMLNHSHRGNGLSFHEATTWSVSPLAFLEILMPNFAGSVLAGPAGWYWLIADENDPYNISNFLGFVPVFFALAGWAMGSDRRRNFVAAAAGTLLLLSLGHFTPVWALARLLLPPLAVVRFPVKLLVHVIILVAILAGWGLDALCGATSPWKASWKRLTLPLLIFLGCTVLALGVAWLAPGIIKAPENYVFPRLGRIPFNLDTVPDYLVTKLRLELPGLAGFCLGGLMLITGLGQGRKWARPGLYAFAVLAMVQLFMVNREANPTVPKSFYTYRPPVLGEFKAPPETYRFLSLGRTLQSSDAPSLQSYVNFQLLPGAPGVSELAQGEFQSRLQLYTGSMYYQVEGSINLDPERSVPPFLYDTKVYLNRLTSDSVPFNCLLGRINVKYIIRPAPAENSVTRIIGSVANGSPLPNPLYEDLCFAPRTYVAGNSLFLTDSDQTLDHLASPDFDALHTVILAAPPGSSPAVSGAGPAGQVEIAQRDLNSITLRAQLERPAYVLLLDRYDPNWQATLDGRPAPVIRANQIFRAVFATQGEHIIKFHYRQNGLKAGLFVSLGTFLVLLAIYVADSKPGGLGRL